ncbi:MAG TPA: sulfatase [Sphingobacteriaceae bacterium]|nr:sulfatase [Sphingobacteriaceae bacterium]
MLKTLIALLRFYCFWLLFFFIDRLVFLLYFTNKLRGISITEISKSFLYGLWMDGSMAAYITVLPLLVFIFCWLFKLHIPVRIPKWYTGVLIILFSLISVINFNIYREWGAKINYNAMYFMFTAPNEALASSASSPIFSSLLILLLLAVVSLWLSVHIIDYRMPTAKLHPALKTALSLLFIGLNFLAIRGGWQLAPMNESMAYFSDKLIINHASVNTEWGFFHSLVKNRHGSSNPFSYYKPEISKALVKELYQKPAEPSPQILTTQRPNIVIFILESFTASVVESLGGEKGITPNMEKLIADGLLFPNTYASGDRTEKGVAAIISAFPAQAIQSIIKENGRQEKLPSLAGALHENGYHTSFYYGGESEFANMKSYILSHSYQRLVDKHAYEKKDMNSKWGAYDEVVFKKQLADLNRETQPFFSTLMTLSNHEPFELPGKMRYGSDNVENKFRSTAYYTDSCIGAYINQAKKQAWYKNTVFVIVADHGHRLPLSKYESYHPARYHIPLLFFGDAIKPEYRGKKIEKIGSQTDIAATLLSQLNINADRFHWSKDLLNPGTKAFSFYDWVDGFGFATPQQIISFDNIGKRIIYKKEKTAGSVDDQLVRYGKAYMQEAYQEYLDY